MAAKLNAKPLKREIRVYGIPVPVIVLLKDTGIEMSVSGFKTKLYASWDHIVREAMLTPIEAPAPVDGKPFEFLLRQAKKAIGRKTKI